MSIIPQVRTPSTKKQTQLIVLYLRIFLNSLDLTQESNKIDLDSEVLILFSILESDGSCPTEIIIFVVDWEFDLVFPISDFVILLVLLLIELYIDLHSSSQASEKR